MTDECAVCGGSFASPAELLAHMHRDHGGRSEADTLSLNPEAATPGLVCALCGKRFRNPRDLAAHNLRPHPRPVPARQPASVP